MVLSLKELSLDRDNCVIVTNILVKLLKISVTKATVKKKVQEHPHHPSLLSIADAFREWNAPSTAFKLTNKNLTDLPQPFVTQIKRNNRELFVVVKSISRQQVHLFNESGRPVTEPIDDFIKSWSGIVLLVEPTNEAGEKDHAIKLKEIRLKKLLLFGFIISLTLFVVSAHTSYPAPNLSFYLFALLLIKLIGSAVCSVLLWYEIDRNHHPFFNICSIGKQTGCTTLLSSKAASISGLIRWSEIGFAYFLGGTLAILAGLSNPELVAPLALLTMLAAPFILYSLYTQVFRLKQLCPLCLTIQILLILELLLAIKSPFYYDTISLVHLSFIFFTCISALLCCRYVKPLMKQSAKGRLDQKRFTKIKNNPLVFDTLLQAERQVVNPRGLGITLGNPQAKYHVIKVCNPYCSPCSKAHVILDELLSQGIIQLQVIFTCTTHENDKRLYPARHFMAIYEKYDKSLTQQALNKWYSSEIKDYTTFANTYRMNGELKNQHSKIEIMQKWCKNAKIQHTPTIFINLHQLPKVYQINDLENILDSLLRIDKTLQHNDIQFHYNIKQATP